MADKAHYSPVRAILNTIPPTDGSTNAGISEADRLRIFAEMFRAANHAVRRQIADRRDIGPSGYASVTVPRGEPLMDTPSNPFRRTGTGHEMSVSCAHYQGLVAKEAVADAIVAVLQRNGVDAYVKSRMD